MDSKTSEINILFAIKISQRIGATTKNNVCLLCYVFHSKAKILNDA